MVFIYFFNWICPGFLCKAVHHWWISFQPICHCSPLHLTSRTIKWMSHLTFFSGRMFTQRSNCPKDKHASTSAHSMIHKWIFAYEEARLNQACAERCRKQEDFWKRFPYAYYFTLLLCLILTLTRKISPQMHKKSTNSIWAWTWLSAESLVVDHKANDKLKTWIWQHYCAHASGVGEPS